MDCWEILEIRKTDDEEAVRKAYLKKLPGFHPEENPEGFRILRQAMEEALRLAAGQRQAGEGGRQTGTMSDSREIRALVRENTGAVPGLRQADPAGKVERAGILPCV